MNLLKSSDDSSIEIGYETETVDELLELHQFVDRHVSSRATSADVRPVVWRIKHPDTRDQVRTSPKGWQEDVDWSVWRAFLQNLQCHVNPDADPLGASMSGIRLHQDLFLEVHPRRTYVQLAYRLGSSQDRSHLLYEALRSQTDAIQQAIGLVPEWGRQRMQMKINLEEFRLVDIKMWPQDAAKQIATLVTRCTTVLTERIKAIDGLSR